MATPPSTNIFVTGLPSTNPFKNSALRCYLLSSSGFSNVAGNGSKFNCSIASSNSGSWSSSSGTINYFGIMKTILIGAADDPEFWSLSALGLARQTCDLIPFLSRFYSCSSSIISSWRNLWTHHFWDLVKPPGHHWDWSVRSGSRSGFLRIGWSSCTLSLAIYSSRSCASTLLPAGSRSIVLLTSRSCTDTLFPSRSCTGVRSCR